MQCNFHHPLGNEWRCRVQELRNFVALPTRTAVPRQTQITKLKNSHADLPPASHNIHYCLNPDLTFSRNVVPAEHRDGVFIVQSNISRGGALLNVYIMRVMCRVLIQTPVEPVASNCARTRKGDHVTRYW